MYCRSDSHTPHNFMADYLFHVSKSSLLRQQMVLLITVLYMYCPSDFHVSDHGVAHLSHYVTGHVLLTYHILRLAKLYRMPYCQSDVHLRNDGVELSQLEFDEIKLIYSMGFERQTLKDPVHTCNFPQHLHSVPCLL